jgi:hypothetical protein
MKSVVYQTLRQYEKHSVAETPIARQESPTTSSLVMTPLLCGLVSGSPLRSPILQSDSSSHSVRAFLRNRLSITSLSCGQHFRSVPLDDEFTHHYLTPFERSLSLEYGAKSRSTPTGQRLSQPSRPSFPWMDERLTSLLSRQSDPTPLKQER